MSVCSLKSNLLKNRELNIVIYLVTATKQQYSKIKKHMSGCYTMDVHNNCYVTSCLHNS